jgi:hypothetical protein
MRASRFSEEQIIGYCASMKQERRRRKYAAAHDLGRDLLHLWTAPPWQEGFRSCVDENSIANIYLASPLKGAPKWGIRSHSPRQVVCLEGHCTRQDLSVPIRSVSPFSDLSSNLA